MPTTKFKKRDELPSRLDDLVALYPPRAIVDDVDYDNTVEMIDALLRLGRRSRGQERYLLTLSQLIGVYDDEHYALDLTPRTALENLRSLVEDHGMTASALGELLGTRSLGSKLLRGERELSKAHIRKLCDHFKLQPRHFL